METRTFKPSHYLNVGMNKAAGGELTKGELLAALRVCKIITAHPVEFHESDTERTAVVELASLPTVERLYTLSELTGQDCVAVYSLPSGDGSLIGPKAKAWGPFNPTYFIMPGGRRAMQCGQAPPLGAWFNLSGDKK